MSTLNLYASTKSNLNISWPLPFYFVISSTFLFMPQWLPSVNCCSLQLMQGTLMELTLLFNLSSSIEHYTY